MEKILPSEIWENLDDRVIIDARSPAEYAHAHVPNALSLPLFNNEERAKVGTMYKQTSPEAALLKGLEIVGPKMSGFVKKAIKWSPNRKVLLYCWRGGKRSGSLAWLLKFAGFDVKIIEGGYKNYRNYVTNQLENLTFKRIVLGGKTGSGKTFILKELEKQGEQIIDLEGMANHKGSAFGWIGEEAQPTSEQFDSNLYEIIRKLDPNRRVWIENESRSIGSVYLQKGFWDYMKAGPLVHLEIPFDLRLQQSVAVYTQTSKEDLMESYQKIAKKIGGENLKNSLKLIEEGNCLKAAEVALRYYDKTYTFNLDNNMTSKSILEIDEMNHEKTAQKLITWADLNDEF